ncbi:MAG: glycosyltransferase [Planctomyces sp.]|nr:glycosyltransferase [Planctomyces sp.]
MGCATTIVIPCYNEERRLDAAAFERFLTGPPVARLLFVNDGSRDGTLELLKALERRHPRRCDVIDLSTNVGKAEAVRCGLRYALEHGADLVGFWDADLATPLDAIDEFVRVLERRRGIDVVIGSRLPLLGHAILRQPRRAALGRVFARAASWTLGVPVRDTQCGAKLFRATPWTVAAFARPFRTRWIFDVEILARLAQLGVRSGGPQLGECVYELPLEDWRDVAGSKLRLRDFLKAPRELASIWRRYLSPLQSRPPEIAAPPAVTLPLPGAVQTAPANDEVRRAA